MRAVSGLAGPPRSQRSVATVACLLSSPAPASMLAWVAHQVPADNGDDLAVTTTATSLWYCRRDTGAGAADLVAPPDATLVHLPSSTEAADACVRALAASATAHAPGVARRHRILFAALAATRFPAIDVDVQEQRAWPIGRPIAAPIASSSSSFACHNLLAFLCAQFDSVDHAKTGTMIAPRARVCVESAGWSASERLESLLCLLLLRDAGLASASLLDCVALQLTCDPRQWWTVGRIARALAGRTHSALPPGVYLSLLTDMATIIPPPPDELAAALDAALRFKVGGSGGGGEHAKLYGHKVADGTRVPYYDIAPALLSAWTHILVDTDSVVPAWRLPTDGTLVAAIWWPLNRRILQWMFPSISPPSFATHEPGTSAPDAFLRAVFQQQLTAHRAHHAFCSK